MVMISYERIRISLCFMIVCNEGATAEVVESQPFDLIPQV